MFLAIVRQKMNGRKRHIGMVPFLAAVIALIIGVTVSQSWADGHNIEDFATTEVFLEFNSTDLDLGLHLFFDAPGWEKVTVEGPNGTTFSVKNGGGLKKIGSTEVFTESAEPPLDEEDLQESIEEFLDMFPEGEYSFEGKTVDGFKLMGTAMLTHDIPSAPGLIFPDSDLEENEADPEDTVIKWEDTSEPGDPEIVRYQVVVEFEEEITENVFEFSVDVLADPNALYQSVTVPEEFFESLEGLEGEYKAEVVAIEGSRNATISEKEFDLEE
ncbi:MAG: hypothetical protein JSV13_09615 [Nitrospiraceae bacterium]|nr:MAG: hypothetical protein JSV13_09615 [Nitrospiraceae bacterium]